MYRAARAVVRAQITMVARHRLVDMVAADHLVVIPVVALLMEALRLVLLEASPPIRRK